MQTLDSCPVIESVWVIFGLFWAILACFWVVITRFGSFKVVMARFSDAKKVEIINSAFVHM